MADFASWLGSGIGTIGSDIGSGISDLGNWLGIGGGVPSSAGAAAAAQGLPAASAWDAVGTGAGSGLGGAGIDWSSLGLTGMGGAPNMGPTLALGGMGASGAPTFTLGAPGGAQPAPSNTFANQLLGLGGGGNATAAPISIGGTSSLPAAAAGGGGTAPGGILSDLPSLATMKNLLPFIGLGVSALTRPSLPSAVQQAAGTAQAQQGLANTAAADAAPLTAQAQGLINSATTGQLPPGAQAVLDQAEAAAKADAASKFAGLGLTGSTSEGSALSSIDLSRAAQEYNMAQTAANTGLSVQQVANSMLSAALGGLGSAGQTYAGIGQIQLANDSALSNALANFAAAAAGSAGYNAGQKPAA